MIGYGAGLAVIRACCLPPPLVVLWASGLKGPLGVVKDLAKSL